MFPGGRCETEEHGGSLRHEDPKQVGDAQTGRGESRNQILLNKCAIPMAFMMHECE